MLPSMWTFQFESSLFTPAAALEVRRASLFIGDAQSICGLVKQEQGCSEMGSWLLFVDFSLQTWNFDNNVGVFGVG